MRAEQYLYFKDSKNSTKIVAYCLSSFAINLLMKKKLVVLLNCALAVIWLSGSLMSFLAHRIRISKILPWDRKFYFTHAIFPRTSLLR